MPLRSDCKGMPPGIHEPFSSHLLVRMGGRSLEFDAHSEEITFGLRFEIRNGQRAFGLLFRSCVYLLG
jgi:hypothetical protein